MTVDADSLFYGPDYYAGARYQREERNRAIVMAKCAAVTVTPEELASCVDESGVDWNKANDLVCALLVRAHDEAVKKTLGL